MFAMLATVVAIAASHPSSARARHDYSVATYKGAFRDGATYIIEYPTPWNGTFVLYSHGYDAPGNNNPAYDVGDPTTGAYLLAKGFALGGSSYAETGWAVAQALPDQMQVLDTFAHLVKRPKRTIAWGHSMGGLITAALVQQYPTRFDAALPMCGAVAGSVGLWDLALDGAFAFNTLLAGGGLQVVNIGNVYANYENAISALNTAQNTAQGRARIALVAAIADIPGWYDPSSPQPAPTDYPTQETNQYDWFGQIDFDFDFALRSELETRSGGNPSFNTGVDYRKQLSKSIDRAEVGALYKSAGLNLDADLQALAAAPRIAAVPSALNYLSDDIILDGKFTVPVLTMHTEGDGLVVDESENAYLSAVDRAGNGARLRRLFVHRAGHCEFSSGETVAAFLALDHRLATGRWDGLQPSYLDGVASGLGSSYNPVPPAFDAFAPAPFLRTYNGTPPGVR